MKELIRLHKYLADCGVTSRRQAEGLIAAGRVRVNDEVIREQGRKIDPVKDKVFFDNKFVEPKAKNIYVKLYKPRGVVSACYDPQERTVIDLVKTEIRERLYPVGRLDKDSEGLILLTNDGEIANRLMHPRYEHEKEYEVTVSRPLTAEMLKKLAAGVEIDGGKTRPAKIFLEAENKFRIVLKEGKKRQIRRMVEGVGNRVKRLVRLRIQNVLLGDLLPGQWRFLTENEKKILLG